VRTPFLAVLAVPLGAALGCLGPEASDAAVCADYIHRICSLPRCPIVDGTFALAGAADCETPLLVHSRCIEPGFTFSTPSRSAFLGCRAPLLRAGTEVAAHPSCEDIAQSFASCPDAVALLAGTDGGTP